MKIHYLIALMSALIVSGCASLPATKTAQGRVIDASRTNISTSTQVSNVAKSVLLSSGYDQARCMVQFETCLADVKNTMLNQEIYRHDLALLAELYYAQALYLQSTNECQDLIRPPLNAYYANAPKDPSVIQEQKRVHEACLDAYKDALLNTLNHSYAYIFYDALMGKTSDYTLVKENDIKAQDLYHVSLNALLGEMYKQDNGAFANASKKHNTTNHSTDDDKPFLLDHYQDGDTVVNLYVNRNDYLLNLLQDRDVQLTDLVSAYDPRMAKLDTASTRSGIGVSFVGALSDRYSAKVTTSKNTTDYNDLKSRIHPTGHILLTAVGKPKGETLDDILNSQSLDVYLLDPYTHKTVEIFNKTYPLSANFSAGYALWLSENALGKVGVLNMLGNQRTPMPELFMLEPYNPNKKTIIMLHGLASSPATWVNLTNNLLADPVLQENYQVWQVFYATNLPILENRYQIQSLIEAAYHFSDPEGVNKASRNSVLIGHSMGGIISRMMLSDDNLLNNLDDVSEITQSPHTSQVAASGSPLDDVYALSIDSPTSDTANNTPSILALQDTQPKHTQNTDATHSDAQHLDTTNQQHISAQNAILVKKLLKQAYQEEFNNRFVLQSLPQVDTAVFISAPLRGTDYAERWFTLLARRIIRLPLDLTQAFTGTVINVFDGKDNSNEDALKNNGLGSLYLDNGASQLSDRSAFMTLTKDIRINPKVRHYSIMGDQKGVLGGDMSKLATHPELADKLSDGIVPYKSSHLDTAYRELVLTGGHGIHESPKTVQELRKILYEHLQKHTAPPTP